MMHGQKNIKLLLMMSGEILHICCQSDTKYINILLAKWRLFKY